MKISIGNANKSFKYRLNLFLILHILSIDVVVGAISCTLMVTYLLNVNPGFVFWIVLPTTVWIVYTLDHLVDGIKLKYTAHTIRHLFHYHYRKILLAIVSLLIVANLLLSIFYLDVRIIYFGVILGLLTGTYLLIVFSKGNRKTFLLQKELAVALIYTLGVWGGSLVLVDFQIGILELLLLASFFLLVLADILMFSIYEFDTDKIDHHYTMAVRYGIITSKRIIYFLLLAVFVLSAFILMQTDNQAVQLLVLIYIIMGLFLTMIIFKQDVLRKNYLYRYIGELIFWLPGLVFLLP